MFTQVLRATPRPLTLASVALPSFVALVGYLGARRAMFSLIGFSRGRSRPPCSSPPPGLLDSTLLVVAFWIGVSAFSGLLFPALLGSALFAYLLHRRALLRSRRKRLRSAPGGYMLW